MYQGARYSLALFSRVLNGRSKRKKVKSERVNVESHSGGPEGPRTRVRWPVPSPTDGNFGPLLTTQPEFFTPFPIMS